MKEAESLFNHKAVDAVLSWVVTEARLAITDPIQAFRELWDTFGPGGRLHPRKFLELHGHLVIESLLFVAIIYLLLQRARKPASKAPIALTEQEVDELCAEWKPEPLVPQNDVTDLNIRTPVLESPTGPVVTVNGKQVINVAALNFWGLSGHPDVQAATRAAINKYGIGSCGPRGFYGTIDVHLHLEHELANFMQTEEAIIYSYDVATQPSVLPAFASRKDVIVLDEAASWPLRNGASLSRAQVVYFRHNDMAHLESVLQQIISEHKRRRKPLNRRFIVVEGISTNGGDLTPLADVVALKERYKFRLVVDESLSFGVLGATGRGACEHVGLPPDAVDIVTASMGTSLASVGGFCVGCRAVVDHQRISSSGYCFSASLPPLLAVAASATLKLFQTQCSDILARLQSNASFMRKELSAAKGLRMINGKADILSPVIHMQLASSSGTVAGDLAKLAALRDHLLDNSGVLVGLHRPTMLDSVHVVPAIKCIVTAAHTKEQLKKVAAAIKTAASQKLGH